MFERDDGDVTLATTQGDTSMFEREMMCNVIDNDWQFI